MLHAHAARRSHAKWRVDAALHEALETARSRSIERPFLQLLNVVLAHSSLLRAERSTGRHGAIGLARLLDALLAIAGRHRRWVRSPQRWSPPDDGSAEQFASLIQHLLATYPVPRFLVRVWLEPAGELAERHRKVFAHVAAGYGIRGADVPLRLTRAMAGYVDDVPDHATVEQAVRWCQVRGLGGSAALATVVVDTHLGWEFDEPAFWENVLRELIRRDVPVRFAKATIGYARENPSALRCRGNERLSNGRFDQLRGLVNAWADRRRPTESGPLWRWSPAAINPFREREPATNPWSVRTWSIRELLDSDALWAEGRDLRHCVGVYAPRCARGDSSIWSLRRHGSLTWQRMLTIEVEPRRREIVTALGFCNGRPDEEVRRVMETWAEREGLAIASWV